MHTKNGLLNRRSEVGPSIRQGASGFVELDGHARGSLHQEHWARDLRGDAGHGLASLEVVEEYIVNFLKAHQTAGPRSLLPAGNSLASLDMRLMQRWLPGMLEEMHYRTYDVSVVRTHHREVLQQQLPPKLEALVLGTAPVAPGEQAHRAADDTLTCLRSIRHLRSWAAASYPEGDADFDNTPWTKGFGHEGDATWRL
jgi:oligoribonuclease (3'-5' exoribonuclease)